MKNDNILYVCLNCGSVSLRIKTIDNYIHPCTSCGLKNLHKTVLDYKTYKKMLKSNQWNNYLNSISDTTIKEKQKLINSYQEEENKFRENYIVQQQKTTRFVPKCPICQSTNLKKITLLKKAAKIGAFGIFGMGDNGKTWQCQDCGSKF